MLLFCAVIIIIIIICFYIFVKRKEYFSIDVDDLGYSNFDNISLANDIDTLQQRTPNIQFPRDELDNSDVIAQMYGDTVFQPAHSIGVSTTTNASMSAFNLAGPSGLTEMDSISPYDSPTNGQINIDEKLAINQQHRGSIAKKAIEGYVRSTKNVYQKYFTNELRENAAREWWDNSSEEGLETDFGFDID
jgi:hypothetical protein